MSKLIAEKSKAGVLRLKSIFILGAKRQSNISLTFKSAPERSEGLAWFVHCCSAQTMTKDL
jgi:hypothetical protein